MVREAMSLHVALNALHMMHSSMGMAGTATDNLVNELARFVSRLNLHHVSSQTR